ncbi:hypothetical protein BKA70DRAFT_1253940 [Coprinopsis sp. MPI-PUGE-AT-0042]|nr:hypothetical protein BKA70DRAFT_1253940 [Coprinopsis sp. MPI-PUGE-AT-0042]
MDNPWAENWAEPAKKPQEEVVKVPQASSPPIVVPAWTLPPQADDEVAIGNAGWAAPSWGGSESTTTGWDKEPTFESTSWQPEATAPTFNDLPPLGKAVTPELDSVSFSVDYDTNKPESSSSGASSVKADSPVISPVRSPVVPVVAIPDDTDGFGSFSAADDLQPEADAWSPTRNAFAEATSLNDDAWGNSWEEPGSGKDSDDDEGPTRDEWETARMEKARQDRHVPPERLNAILAEFEQAAVAIWPETKKGEEEEASRPVDLENVVSGSVRLMLVPEGLSLEMQKPFKQTFIAKHEAEALKLSKNSIIARKGPMAMYLESKGSTSWETAVKTTADLSSTDAAPAGWKIVPKEQQTSLDAQAKKPAAPGGILSFFSRRSNSTASPSEPQPPSPSKSVKAATESPRPSVDSPVVPLPAPAKPSTVSATPAPAIAAAPAVVPVAVTPASLSSPALDFFSDEDKEPKETPPPSVVSRFLGRFSRNKANDRASMALSTDDLEFLDDVVPTTNEHDSMDDQLKALSNMIHAKTPSLPTALPAPLAPPPRSTPIKRQPTNPPPVAKPQPSTVQEDLFSLFDSPIPNTQTSGSSNQQSPPLPTLPTSSSFDLLNGSSIPAASTSSLSFTSSTGSPSSTVFSSESNTSFSSRVMTPPIPPPKTNLPPSIMDFSSTLVPSRTPSRASTTTPSHRATPSASMSPPFPPPPRPPSSIAPLAPPPISNRAFVATKPAAAAAPAFGDDDDFDDFVTSPSSRAPAAPSFSSFAPPPAPAKSMAPAKVDTSWDDEFGDFTFFNANSNKPTPPTPAPGPASPVVSTIPAPSAPVARMTPPTGPSSSTPPPQIQVQRKSSVRVSKAEHQRTLSLMETVASRGNSWKAPPSPLPQALPPPDPPAGKSRDPFGGSIFASLQEQPIPNLAPPSLAPTPPPAFRQAGTIPPPNLTPTPPPASRQSASIPAFKPPPSVSPPPVGGSKPFGGVGGAGMGWKFPPPPPAGGSRSGTPVLSPPTGSRVPSPLPPPPGSRSGTPGIAPPPPSNVSNAPLSLNGGFFGSSPTPPPPKGTLPPAMKPLSATSTGSSGKAGLSASDLAFFEGL